MICIFSEMNKYYLLIFTVSVFYSCKKENNAGNNTQQPSTVYLSSFTLNGTYSPVYGDTYIATYFKNNIRHTIGADTIKQNRTTGIYVSGPDVWVSGFEAFHSGSVAKYWKNGQPFLLTDTVIILLPML